jgi:DNA transposition AAA+ family ATPase
MRDGLIHTDNVRRGLMAIQDLKRQPLSGSGRNLAVLEGLTGRGKTMFGEWYTVQDADCFFIEADENWTPSWLLRDVAEALGLTRAHSSETNKRAIVESQRQREGQNLPPRLLLIDEATRILPLRLLETVRGLHDKARLPIVLAGETGIWGAIFRKSPRFADRVSQVVTFGDVSVGDIEAAARDLADLQLSPAVAKQIQRQAGGNFRRAAKVLAELERVLKANPGEISAAKVDLAIQNLQLAEARETRRRAAAGG